MSFHYCKIDRCHNCGRRVYCVTCHIKDDECMGQIFENGPLEMFDPDSDHWSNQQILPKRKGVGATIDQSLEDIRRWSVTQEEFIAAFGSISKVYEAMERAFGLPPHLVSGSPHA